jgi:hypothetical protein
MFLCAAAFCAAQDLYVSPQGDDANPGTADNPVRTIQHARDLARQMKNAKPLETDLTVHLAAGTYRLSEPLVFEPRDSGEKGHSIIYAGPEAGMAALSGGLQLTGWKLVEPQRNLWAAPAPAQIQNTRQLYVNGVRASRARGPLPVALSENPHGYTADSDLMSARKCSAMSSAISTVRGTPSIATTGRPT